MTVRDVLVQIGFLMVTAGTMLATWAILTGQFGRGRPPVQEETEVPVPEAARATEPKSRRKRPPKPTRKPAKKRSPQAATKPARKPTTRKRSPRA